MHLPIFSITISRFEFKGQLRHPEELPSRQVLLFTFYLIENNLPRRITLLTIF